MRLTAGSMTRRIGTAIIIAATAALTAATPAGADTIVYPATLDDAFFSTPADIADRQPGDVLAVRAVPPPLGFPGTDAVQLKFRSTNSHGEPISAVTTVLSPHGAAPGRPLLSYQAIINALGLECAPSTALYAANPLRGIREAPGLFLAIQRGWSLAIPDHLGPNSAYGAAKVGAQITLDGIRAVQQHSPLRLADSPVGLAGYSGGGMTTAMAAVLAPTYAPELDLVGSAFGGAPLDIGEMAKGLGESAHPAFGLAMAAALGLEREYPDRMPITAQLNEPGQVLRDRIANACTNEILASGAGLSIADVADPAVGMSLRESPSVRKVLIENSVEQVQAVPNAPVYEWHSPTDVLIPLDSITTTLRRYCDAGVPVRSEHVPSPDHITAAVIGLPGALDFFDGRFAGVEPTSNC